MIHDQLQTIFNWEKIISILFATVRKRVFFVAGDLNDTNAFDSKCSFIHEHNYENISYDQQIWRWRLNFTNY